MLLERSKKIIIWFCFIFTAATLASCILNLSWGYETDTYIHILDRACLSLAGAAVLVMILDIPWKNKFLKYFIPYVIFMSLAFLYIFFKGVFQELHPNAYRDIFLNDTIAYAAVCLILLLRDKIGGKNGRGGRTDKECED